jgi:hypothetical protein
MNIENLSTLKINTLKSQEQFDKAEVEGRINNNELYLVPETPKNIDNGEGEDSVAQINARAIGPNSAAFGKDTAATKTAAFAEGYSTRATGIYAHAEGRSAQATAEAAHAEGIGTQATATAAHASGSYTVASHNMSSAAGTLT